MEQVDVWSQSFLAAMTTLWAKLASFAPNLLGALLILVLGYVVARLLAALSGRLLAAVGVDRFSSRSGFAQVLSTANIELRTSQIVGRIIFWILMLTFLVSATETLGLPRVSATIDSLVQYLPKLIGAVFMLLLGLFVAGFVRDVIRTAATGIGFEYAQTLGSAAYGVLIVIVVALAIGQLDLEMTMLTQAISIVLLSVGAAAALAFGLGSRNIAANVLAGTYLRESFKEGSEIQIDETTRGRLKAIGSINTTLETPDGEISVPNNLLVERIAIVRKSADS